MSADVTPGRLSEVTTLRIGAMDCPTEEALIRKRLAVEPRVGRLSFDLLARRLTVSHESGALPVVQEALAAIGMTAEVHSADVDPAEVRPADVDTAGLARRARFDPRDLLARHWRLLLGGAAAVAAEVVALTGGDRTPPALMLALLAIGFTGLSTYKKGWIAIRQRVLNINALMAIAVTGALLIGQWPEAAMVMFLFAVAESIEAHSLQRARRAIERLMSMAPEQATVRTGDRWEVMPAASVPVGAIVRVRPGERVPLDGVLVCGAATLDQAPITGESVPVDKVSGDPLFAGTINRDGEFSYATTATGDDSTLARIVRAVQAAQATKAPTQRLVDRFAAVYTPIVVGLAVAVALVPPLVFGAAWLDGVYRALVMLVVACPCALVISTPVTVVSGLTAAARRGILVKGGQFLEGGHALTVLALDKTGTLTHGKPAVTRVVVLEGEEADAVRLAAALASRSDHPVSRAVALLGSSAAGIPEVDHFRALAGRGVTGIVAGRAVSLGNRRLVEEAGANSPALALRIEALEEEGQSAVVLLSGARPLAVFAVADTVRPQSAAAVAELKRLGIRPIMLTGDNRHTAQAIARQVGIADVRSELLPEDKLAVIARFQGLHDHVGMVGDGINDAPALARADIGFAMGAAGSDTAIETADVALMDDDPRKLAEFVRLSRSTRTVLWQNIVLAVGIKLVFLLLTMTGHATLWMAVFADMGTSLLVVFNGLRLLKHARPA